MGGWSPSARGVHLYQISDDKQPFSNTGGEIGKYRNMLPLNDALSTLPRFAYQSPTQAVLSPLMAAISMRVPVKGERDSILVA